MASPPKPWKAEYAKSARSSCKTCKNNIDKENLRLGKIVQSTQFDGLMPMWNHVDCVLGKANQINFLDDVEGLELLRWEDQQKIRKYVEGCGPSNAPTPADTECGIEASQTSRATCRRCNQKIMKGVVRVSTKPDGQGARSLAWHHANCFIELWPTSQVHKLSGWDSLSASDQAAVLDLVKNVPSATKGKVEPQEDKEPLQQSTSKGGAKRKSAVSSDHKSKLAKGEDAAFTNKTASVKKAHNLKNEHSKA